MKNLQEYLIESIEHPGKDQFSGVSFNKFKEYLEKEGYSIDNSQTHEYNHPFASKDITFTKAGDLIKYVVTVECEPGIMPQTQMDYIYRIIKVDPSKPSYEKNLVMRPDFKDSFWKPMKYKK